MGDTTKPLPSDIWRRIGAAFADAFCKICGKPDWCLETWKTWGGLPEAVICARYSKPIPGSSPYKLIKHIPNSRHAVRLKTPSAERERSATGRQRRVLLRPHGTRGAPSFDQLSRGVSRGGCSVRSNTLLSNWGSRPTRCIGFESVGIRENQ